MDRKKMMSPRSKKSQTLNLKFECKASQASAIFLAGSFNDWDESATPMTRGEDGLWATSLKLPPGRYEYKFIIDGLWSCSPELLPDPTTASCIPNPFGTTNFAIDVSMNKP